jgi:copper chaperone NosL
MIVSEERFAAAVVVEADGRTESHVFDDVGCLFMWEAGGGADAAVLTRWVHDYNGGGWAPAESAWYVKSAEIRSPMGSGVASCAAQEEAERLSRLRDGTVLDWGALRELARSEGLVAPPPPAVES